jgi:hypothetical protein
METAKGPGGKDTMTNARTVVFVAALAALACANDAAAADAALKCRVTKTRSAGDYVACREKALNASLLKNVTVDYGRCLTKFTEKWNKADNDGGDACPDDIAFSSMETYLAEHATEAAELIAGTKSIPGCGDGVINASFEHCDGASLDGLSCASFGLFGSLACTAGCELDLGNCSRCPSGAYNYANACWYLGAPAESCNDVCAAEDLSYDAATSLVAGSSGSDTNCETLLDAFDAPGGALDNPGGDCGDYGLGCAVNVTMMGVYRARCGIPATNAADGFSPIQRVCACQ